jgi:hypothetical protein
MKIVIKLLVHSIFWLVFILVNYAFGISRMAEDYPAAYNQSAHLIINAAWAAAAFYLFYFYAIKLFEKRHFVVYLGLSLGGGLAIALFFFAIHKIVLPEFNFFNMRIFLPPIAGTFIIEQCGSLVRGFENWFANMQLKAELENINLKNELELLKAQINPHFLFNTLNNIDSLIFISPDEASKSLITLSDMLRYMIYETKQDFVPLEKEINHIQSYIQLQKMRFRDAGYILFEYDKNSAGIMIAPALLSVFIENAFKHSYRTGDLPVIEIKINFTGGGIVFLCANQFNNERKTQNAKGGLGLVNVKRRLQLLYPEKHELNISQANNKFTVELKLKTT